MITTTTKNEIFNSLKYFYTSTNFNIKGLKTTFNKDYNDAKDFETILYKENTRMFFRDAVTLKDNDFINCIKNEYRLFSIFSTNTENINWLQNTYNFIININDLSGFISKSDTVAFLDWYDTVKIEPELNSVEKYRPFYQQRQFTDFANKMNADKTQNIHFLPTITYDWKESINKTVDENTTLTPEVKEKLKSYNWKIYDFTREIIQLYKGVHTNHINKIHIHESRIKYRLTTIIDFAELVTFYELKDDFPSATKIKKHCLMILKNAIDNLKDVYSIDILKTPLKTDIEAVNEALNNSINIDEVVKLQGLNNVIKKPQQKDIIKDEVIIDEPKKELHNNIFVGNAFEVWQSMFDEFDIKESSRSDVKFMFEIMRSKGENLIYKTVNQKSFLEWITDTYNGLIVEKISNYNKTKSRLNAYSRAKELYKK